MGEIHAFGATIVSGLVFRWTTGEWGLKRYTVVLAALMGVLSCGTCLGRGHILPKFTAKVTPVGDTRPSDLPADAELESRGARIGVIRFEPLRLFDTGGVDDDAALFRVANHWHISTRNSTVSDQLLFKSGDVYRPRLLQESERMLRDTRYLRDAKIRPVAFHDGVVDIVVVTQDVWTLDPSVSFGRTGGKSTTGFKLEELNVLGLGTQVGIAFQSGVDRDSKSVFYRDRQLGSSWWSLAAQYSDNSDGRRADLSIRHPFYALDTPWATGLQVQDDRRVDSRYDLGKVIDQFETTEKQSTLFFGKSSGLHNGWVRRYLLGATFDQRTFANAPGLIAARLLPQDRKLVYPWVGVEWLQDQYRIERNRDQIEKTEDYSLGWRASASVGFASESLGSDLDSVVFRTEVARGIELTDRQTLLLKMAGKGRVGQGALQGSVWTAESRYYFRQSAKHLLFAGVSVQSGSHLDPEQQIVLGGDNGLRGYPLRYQAGTGSWLFTAEQRVFTNWYPFQLFNVGGAVFYDMGKTWGRDPLASRSQGVLKNIGLGLRLGNSRSAIDNVVHIDLAFPLDGDPSIKKVQFLVETKVSL
jgi:outer membrane protein assembly factor BamA